MMCPFCRSISPQDEGLTRNERSSPKVNVHQLRLCANARDCYPPNLAMSAVPTNLINCTNGICVCNECFVLMNDTCAAADCFHYSSGSQKCDDRHKSQSTTFYLSLFLSSVGAANFYIGQNELGKYCNEPCNNSIHR